MGAEISRVIVQPISDAWVAFNRYCLDSCTSNCETPCCNCGIETHHSPDDAEVAGHIKEEKQ